MSAETSVGKPRTYNVGASATKAFVAYYRVSTPDQELSGFGLEAQRRDVQAYVASVQGNLAAEFSETGSGRSKDRPHLRTALRICRLTRATLVIARLDRLARNLNLISGLIESKLEFVALDCPHANKFTIHVLAALAEYESQLHSERISLAHAANRRRGVVYRKPPCKKGKPLPDIVHLARTAASKARAEGRANDLAPTIWPMIETGRTYAEIATEMNRLEVPTANGKPRGWSKHTVFQIIKKTRQAHQTIFIASGRGKIGIREHKISNIVDLCRPTIVRMRRAGACCKDIAKELNRLRIPHPNGKLWTSDTTRLYALRALEVSSIRAFRKLRP